MTQRGRASAGEGQAGAQAQAEAEAEAAEARRQRLWEWNEHCLAPFRRPDENMSWTETLRLVLWLPIVLLRAVSIAAVLLPYFACAMLVQAGVLRLVRHGGNVGIRLGHGIRRALLLYTRVTARIMLFFMGYHHIQVRGRVPGQEEPAVLVSTHLSYVEILYYVYAHTPAFVFKRSMIQLPVIGPITHFVLDSVPVDNRQGGRGGSAAVVERINCMYGEATGASDDDRAKHAARANRTLVVFPEGTTTNGTRILRFRTGAFLPGKPVTPVAVRLPFTSFSATHESIFVVPHVLRLLSQPSNRMEVTYLPRVDPTEEQCRKPCMFAAHVEGLLSRYLNIPVVDAHYRHKQVYHRWLYRQLTSTALPHRWLAFLLYVHPPYPGGSDRDVLMGDDDAALLEAHRHRRADGQGSIAPPANTLPPPAFGNAPAATSTRVTRTPSTTARDAT